VILTDEPFPVFSSKSFTEFLSYFGWQTSVVVPQPPSNVIDIAAVPIAAWLGNRR
jgi:hypothetical protein